MPGSTSGTPDDSNSVRFEGVMQWPYLDYGILGQDKTLEGFDIVCTGSGTLAVGYDETNFAFATTPFPFDGDTLPGLGGIPFELTAPSMQVRLTFDAGQEWEWEALNVYIDARMAK